MRVSVRTPMFRITRNAVVTTAVVTAATLPTLSCSSQKEAAAPEGPETPPTLSELLPLQDGTVSSFGTENDLGERGLFVLDITRPREGLVELTISGQVQRFSVRDNAVEHATGGFLLHTPLDVGATFRGSFGNVTITGVNETIEVPAGTFEHCLTTKEESARPPKVALSTFCPGVGLTVLTVEGAGDAEVLRLEARLKSHGPRVNVRTGAGLEEASDAPDTH